jgi:putative transposase
MPTLEGYLFLGVVMDIFSRKIVGWSMRDDLKADLVVDALAMAVTRRRPPAGLVHHCDRGSQCTSLAFGRTLRESELVASIGSRGDAYDNAACESCISTLKVEWIKRHRYRGRDEARLSIFRTSRRSTTSVAATPHSAASVPTSTKIVFKLVNGRPTLIQ